jgi:hypothetical protein
MGPAVIVRIDERVEVGLERLQLLVELATEGDARTLIEHRLVEPFANPGRLRVLRRRPRMLHAF